jgi:hypothetical protein
VLYHHLRPRESSCWLCFSCVSVTLDDNSLNSCWNWAKSNWIMRWGLNGRFH